MQVFLRRSLALVLMGLFTLGVAGCAAMGQDGPLSVPVRLVEAGEVATGLGPLRFAGTLHLRDPNKDFGGLSSLRVSPDGSQFIAITDRGRRVLGRLSYADDGTLNAASDLAVTPLLGTDGQGLPGFFNDTEGLAQIGPWPGDGWVVSVERRHSLLRYPPSLTGAAAQAVEGPEGLAALPFNQGLETVLSLADGHLLLIAEGGDDKGLHPAWIGRSGQWRALQYQALPPFWPVDAALLPNGDVLVLERRAGFMGGWGSRIVQVPVAALNAGQVIQGQEIARLSAPMVTENYEGIATRVLPDGGVAIYLVSDDNFKPVLQRTLLTMFRWGP